MEPFVIHQGVAAPLLRINVDTDAIIPSREMKSVSKRGLSGGLFAGWRYTTPGGREANPEFVLNQAEYADTSILLSGANFGCGSSREHAVWALAEYGIRSIIAPSFGAIFYGNCVRNGLLPLVLDDASIQAISTQVAADPKKNQLTIDLQNRRLTTAGGQAFPFELEDGYQQMLLEGLDPIGLTLKMQNLIDRHIDTDRQQRPWAYIS